MEYKTFVFIQSAQLDWKVPVKPEKTGFKPKVVFGFYNYLSRHYFRICATNLDSSVQTSSVMSLDYIPAVGFVSSNTTVVRTCKYAKCYTARAKIHASVHIKTSKNFLTLWSRETIRRPAKWVSIRAQDGVLLLHAKPRVLVCDHVHHFLACEPKVGFCRDQHGDLHTRALQANLASNSEKKNFRV